MSGTMMRRIYDTREILFGIGMVGAGALISIVTANSVTGAHVAGPKLFPYLVALGLVLTGATFVRSALRQPSGNDIEVHWQPVLLIACGLAAELALLVWFGWIPAATVLFMAVAQAFGYRRLAVNLLLGALMATVLFLGFDFGLGLQLPAGSLVEAFVE